MKVNGPGESDRIIQDLYMRRAVSVAPVIAAKAKEENLEIPGDRVAVSGLGKTSSSALLMYNDEDQVRPDVVAKAKDALQKWQPLGGAALDKVATGILRA